MGGMGSGNLWRYGTKGVCEEQKRVDMSYMRKQGLLAPGKFGSLSWSCRGEPAGDIRFRIQDNGIRLIYRTRDYGEDDWESVDELVPFAFTRQNLGGQRRWFVCLSCRNRCSVLYGGSYFRCRKCSGLAYQSQNGSHYDRALSKARKIRLQLGGPEDLSCYYYPKPKGMHTKTYEKLDREMVAADHAVEFHLIGLMSRLTGIG